jgi:hypothetical protein
MLFSSQQVDGDNDDDEEEETPVNRKLFGMQLHVASHTIKTTKHNSIDFRCQHQRE